MTTRRDFLKTAGALAVWPLASVRGAASLDPPAWPPPVGYATISWPESQFADALETISRLSFAGLQMLGWVRDANSGDKTVQLKQHLQKLKLYPAALSCSHVKLDPARLVDGTAEFKAYAAFLNNLGGRYLQVTDGGHPQVKYSDAEIAALGAQMNALGKLAREHGLMLGYHPHFGTLGETREGLGRVLAATDPSDVKLIADVAHLTLGGSDPAEVIRTYHDRVVLLHFKDLRKDVAEQARQDRDLVRHSKYHFCEIGTGVVDFPPILAELRKLSSPYWIIVELDAYEPPPGGPAESARMNKAALEKLGLPIRPQSVL
ncbi:MAG TPA: sugar phosphate isomerase/epimerase [Terriglobia bacterium]|nr:sugar phosphate isomerase/epimerase [Terriglobia bacterium]